MCDSTSQIIDYFAWPVNKFIKLEITKMPTIKISWKLRRDCTPKSCMPFNQKNIYIIVKFWIYCRNEKQNIKVTSSHFIEWCVNMYDRVQFTEPLCINWMKKYNLQHHSSLNPIHMYNNWMNSDAPCTASYPQVIVSHNVKWNSLNYAFSYDVTRKGMRLGCWCTLWLCKMNSLLYIDILIKQKNFNNFLHYILTAWLGTHYFKFNF